MAVRLENKVVLITGVGGGLGTAQGELIAAEGAKIIAANIKNDPIFANNQPKDAIM